MNGLNRVLRVMAGEPKASMTGKTAHTLVLRDGGVELTESTVKRNLRRLREGGLVDSHEQYDFRKNRFTCTWFVTQEGIRRATYL